MLMFADLHEGLKDFEECVWILLILTSIGRLLYSERAQHNQATSGKQRVFKK